MLEAIMEITFFEKKNELYKDWSGYDATRILRPAFNLGAGLFSGSITSDETMYYWNTGYLVFVQFFTIDTIEVYREVETHLVVGKVYDSRLANGESRATIFLSHTPIDYVIRTVCKEVGIRNPDENWHKLSEKAPDAYSFILNLMDGNNEWEDY